MQKFLALTLTLSLAAVRLGWAADQPAAPTKEAFLKILKSQTPFTLKEQGMKNRTTLLSGILNDQENDFIREIAQFAVIDLDGHGAQEVLIELSLNGDIIVFHADQGVIDGYLFSYRGLNSLKVDGAFSASSGADDSSVDRLHFENGVSRYETITSDQDSDLMAAQDQKEDAPWHEFSPTTFDADFAAAKP